VIEHRLERGRERIPQRERGFALLLVFALAASVAILIYLELPRVAFEHQRDKEALLIDRGEQYVRAIELYTRKMNKYPQTLDDLEHAQTIRFLRRRYKDPMTGKDEWRLVHRNANGQYVDSKVHKPSGALEKADSGPSVLASKIQGVGQSATLIPQDGQGVSAALQKHASDRITPGGTPGAGSGEAGQNGAASATQDPNQAQTNAAPAGQAPGTTPGGLANSARFPFPAQSAVDSQSQGNPSIATPAFGAVLPSAPQDGTNNTSNQAGPSQSQAMQAVQSILGTQRTAAPGAGTSQAGGPPSALGGGLVGVATKSEMEGIRRYKDHSNYSEWEFLYDPKDAKGQGQGSGTQQGGTGNAAGNAAGAVFGGMPGGLPAPPTAVPNN
jgi:hypothetical protein